MTSMTESEIQDLYDDWEIRSQAVTYLKLLREYDARITSAWVIHKALGAVELESRSSRDAVLFQLAEQVEDMRLALAELHDPLGLARNAPDQET